MERFDDALLDFERQFAHRSWYSQLKLTLLALRDDVNDRLEEQDARLRKLERGDLDGYDSRG